MSKKKVQSRCLVIDACIAEAAGSSEHPPPSGARCREFLMAVRSVCHRIAWSETVKREWDEHMRRFATDWLVSMTRLRKLQPVKDERLDELRQAIEKYSDDRKILEKVLKDVHLFEAALATDMRIASWDENTRGHFMRVAKLFPRLRSILWVDPVTEDYRAVEWLEEGARTEQPRKLNP
jgi:hypothetical protein